MNGQKGTYDSDSIVSFQILTLLLFTFWHEKPIEWMTKNELLIPSIW